MTNDKRQHSAIDKLRGALGDEDAKLNIPETWARITSLHAYDAILELADRLDKSLNHIADSANRHEDMLHRLDERQAQHSCTLDLLTLKHAERLEALEERLDTTRQELQLDYDPNAGVEFQNSIMNRVRVLELSQDLEERLYRLEDQSIPELCMRVKDLEDTYLSRYGAKTPTAFEMNATNRLDRLEGKPDSYQIVMSNQPTPQMPDLSEAISILRLNKKPYTTEFCKHNGDQWETNNDIVKGFELAIAILERAQSKKESDK